MCGMTIALRGACVLVSIAILTGTPAAQVEPGPNPVVVFETEKGAIEMEVDRVHAPASTANFLKYVDGGFYDGGVIDRAVRPDNTVRHDVEIQVIQFQINPARRGEQFPPIPLERTSVTGLQHVDGTLSMARGAPDTARGSFSIVIGDQPAMNFGGRRNPDGQGFAAFGRVVRGMDVVKAIQASPTGQRGGFGTESLEPPIRIERAYRRQSADWFGSGHAAMQNGAVRNRVGCDTLSGFSVPATTISLPTSGATIGAADLVPASRQTIAEGRAVLAMPEYCRVTGRSAPVDPAAPPINFHVNLPTSWNRKLAHLGGSGQNGVIPVALTTGMQWGPESIPPNAPYALSRGFVVYGSDSGHQGGSGRGADGAPQPDWSTNDEAFTNFAYAQMKKTHDVAVALVARFYGESIRHSYYLGSSQGGREALIVAQRFPQDYDGVFAQVPAHAYVHLSIGEQLARAKAQQGDGWIPPAKVAVIAKEVRRQCDALDGIADGLVSNYMTYDRRFDPAKTPNPLAAVRCDGGADTGESCLSDAQIRAANAVHGSLSYPFPLANGWTTFSGWPTGSESATNWKTLPTRPTPATDFGVLRSRIVRAPNANLLEVDLAKHANALQELSELIDATNPDLSRFRRRGGRLILKVNTTDYSVNPRWVMDYYENMRHTMGASAVDEFVRFYVAVGLFHNRNVGRNPLTNALVPGYVDFVAMLDDWVEHGKAPADTQVLSEMDTVPPFTVNATFPMCAYPMYPRYRGTGDPKAAASYACTRPD